MKRYIAGVSRDQGPFFPDHLDDWIDDEKPQAMRQHRETVEHPCGTIKMRPGATHFLMKRLKNVRTDKALSVLASNLTRVINILGIAPLFQATRAWIGLFQPQTWINQPKSVDLTA